MRMNYRHAFHAGNHADVLKHLTVLALCDALTAKPAPVFALDTHAGRGLYALDSNSAQRTGEAQGGIGRLAAEAPADPLVQRYLQAVRACFSLDSLVPAAQSAGAAAAAAPARVGARANATKEASA